MDDLVELLADHRDFKDVSSPDRQRLRGTLTALLAHGFSVGMPELKGSMGNGTVASHWRVALVPATENLPFDRRIRSSGELKFAGAAIPAETVKQLLAAGYATSTSEGLVARYDYRDGRLTFNERTADATFVEHWLKATGMRLETALVTPVAPAPVANGLPAAPSVVVPDAVAIGASNDAHSPTSVTSPSAPSHAPETALVAIPVPAGHSGQALHLALPVPLAASASAEPAHSAEIRQSPAVASIAPHPSTPRRRERESTATPLIPQPSSPPEGRIIPTVPPSTVVQPVPHNVVAEPRPETDARLADAPPKSAEIKRRLAEDWAKSP